MNKILSDLSPIFITNCFFLAVPQLSGGIKVFRLSYVRGQHIGEILLIGIRSGCIVYSEQMILRKK